MDYKHKYNKYKRKYIKLKYGGVIPNTNNNITHFIVTTSNKEDDFMNLLNLLRRMPYFKKYGYKIDVPENKEFQELAEHPEKIDSIDKTKYYKIFIKDIYKEIPKTYMEKMLSDNSDNIDKIFAKLKKLKHNWNFKLFDMYEISLTKWSPGGSYNYHTGAIQIKVNDVGIPTYSTDYQTLIHEIVHMGIEELIVKKYKLEHWEKEYLVDTICKVYLDKLMPGYQIQQSGKKYEKMRDFVNYGSIQKDLPNAIKQYIKNKESTPQLKRVNKKSKSKNKQKYYYHGSPVDISGYLEPRPSPVIDNEKAVFATNKKYIALAFIPKWYDKDINLGFFDRILVMTEQYENAFDILNVSGYLYYVDASLFHNDKRLGMQGDEFISKKKVKILKKVYIENVYDKLKKSPIKLVKYKPTIDYGKYNLIGIGDFSHGDQNIWTYRFNMLKNIIISTDKKIIIFNEDSEEHCDNIMNTKKKLSYYKDYGVEQDKYAYGPIEKYAYRIYDSPIYLEIIKYIRKNKNRITIVGVDNGKLARDKNMANIILKRLNKYKINIFWAHNDHVDSRKITQPYETKWHDEKYRCGYYLKKKLKDKYCIVLSTGYKGKIRFDGRCSDKYCTDIKYYTKPMFRKFIIKKYSKYTDGLHKNFDDKIAEYSQFTFPNNKLYMMSSRSYDYVLFFKNVIPLPLIS